MKKLVSTLNAAALPEGNAVPEWIRLPYANVPYNRNGIVGTQKLDKPVALELISWFSGELISNPKIAAGLPFYVGHPDFFSNPTEEMEWVRNQPPAIGWVKELRATDDALELRVEWTDEGAKLVSSKTYKFFSPYLLNELVSAGTYIPRMMKSCGLSNTPNWPMPPMVNADTSTGGDQESDMTLLESLIALLGDTAITTDDQVVERVKALIAQAAATKQEATAATANAASATAKELATRKAFATHIVNAAISRGAVLQDHASSRIDDMVNAGDFSAKMNEINSLPRLMKTASDVADAAKSRVTTVSSQRGQIVEAVNAEMKKSGLSYDDAFIHIQRTQPALFATA